MNKEINYISTNQEIIVGYALEENWFDPAFCNQPASEVNSLDFDVWNVPREGKGDAAEKDTKAQALFCFAVWCHMRKFQNNSKFRFFVNGV